MVEQRNPRQRDEGYLAWLSTQPCCLCGKTDVQAAHLRLPAINDEKRETGMQERPSDKWALPLCVEHHRKQHATNEREFWASYGIDPVALCMHYNNKKGDADGPR